MEMIPREKSNAEHYQWGDRCDGWFLVKSEGLTVIEERMPAGTAERTHKHLRSRQFFFVLSGEAVMEVGGVDVPIATGQGLEINPGVPHKMKNASPHDLAFLVISQPPSHGDRINLE
jgi:mannose-6-phosphate isomerase-like protein (cupin superfamily)